MVDRGLEYNVAVCQEISYKLHGDEEGEKRVRERIEQLRREMDA